MYNRFREKIFSTKYNITVRPTNTNDSYIVSNEKSFKDHCETH